MFIIEDLPAAGDHLHKLLLLPNKVPRRNCRSTDLFLPTFQIRTELCQVEHLSLRTHCLDDFTHIVTLGVANILLEMKNFRVASMVTADRLRLRLVHDVAHRLAHFVTLLEVAARLENNGLVDEAARGKLVATFGPLFVANILVGVFSGGRDGQGSNDSDEEGENGTEDRNHDCNGVKLSGMWNCVSLEGGVGA